VVRVILATDRTCVQEATELLRHGELVCYPTDTLYGIGAAASDDEAVRRLFTAKGRPPEKPVPLLIADAGDAARLAEVTPLARILMARFWPGALTVIMKRAGGFRSLALAGQETVALRVPDHPLVREIIRSLGEPIIGTSANRAGAPPPISAAEAAVQVGAEVALIIDSGPCPRRQESTIIDITQELPQILREGAVGREKIEETLRWPLGKSRLGA